jgi:hypothetical protein
MVFGRTMGDDDHVLIALGSVRTAERKARRVEMMKALINPFLDTHRKGKLTQEEITPRGGDLIEAAAEFEAVAHGSVEARAKQHVEGFVDKKLGGQREGTIGKPSAIQHHPSHSFPRGDCFLVMPRQARVDHLNDP